MASRITFVVNDDELAEFIVEDTKRTDSMCITDADGNDHEFNVTEIEITET